MTAIIPPIKGKGRKRGAQPSNSNTLKHGIYSRYYTPEEILALDKDVAGSLKDELEILRLAIFDTAESVLKEPDDSLSFHDHVTALRTISVAIARLENIIQVRMSTFGDPDRREQQVESILALIEQSEIDDTKDLPSQSTIPRTLPKYEVYALSEVEGFGDESNRHSRSIAQHFVPEGYRGDPEGTPLGEQASIDRVDDPSRRRRGGVGVGLQSVPRLSKKKSGAQPGNLNAFKHGFYAHSFSPSEKKLLRGDEADHLRHEETLLRVLVLRTWRSMRAVRASIPWQEYLYTLRSIGYAIFVIAKLQRARRRFFGDLTDLEKDIQLGLLEACADLGILDYFNAQVKK